MFYVDIAEPQKVLDLGYGMGLWIAAVADKYAECEVCICSLASICPSQLKCEQVTGVDLRPLDMMGFPQENLTLECDDLNNSLTDVYAPRSFDVIQSRLVGPGIHKDRWPSYLREIRE